MSKFQDEIIIHTLGVEQRWVVLIKSKLILWKKGLRKMTYLKWYVNLYACKSFLNMQPDCDKCKRMWPSKGSNNYMPVFNRSIIDDISINDLIIRN